MIYTDEQIAMLRGTSIVGVLAALGCRTDHTSKNLYYSPFRDERTPSFHVDDVKHFWCDFGEDGRRHDVIDLVMRLKGCRFGDALDYLASYTPSVYVSNIVKESRKTQAETSIIIRQVKKPVWAQSLRDYALNDRHISAEVLDRYCSQVNYTIEKVHTLTGEVSSKNYFSIGFPNSSGGWALRNPAANGKTAAISAGFTLIHDDGTLDKHAGPVRGTAAKVAVFEGFFDFLSWLEIRGCVVPAPFDAVVLNSVTNVDHALELAASYPVVRAFLDNDKAGEVATSKLEKAVAGAGGDFRDKRPVFSHAGNDLNEALPRILEEKRRELEMMHAQRPASTQEVVRNDTPQQEMAF